jgi:hypothetical protein
VGTKLSITAIDIIIDVKLAALLNQAHRPGWGENLWRVGV